MTMTVTIMSRATKANGKPDSSRGRAGKSHSQSKMAELTNWWEIEKTAQFVWDQSGTRNWERLQLQLSLAKLDRHQENDFSLFGEFS
jgi:hypothetical protein